MNQEILTMRRHDFVKGCAAAAAGSLAQAVDLPPAIRTELSRIWTKEGEEDVEEQAHGSADDRCAEAG